MDDCEGIQIALERRARGELPDELARGLAGHLAGCPDCRAYQHQVQGIDALVQAGNAAAGPPSDFSPVLAYILRREQEQARKMWTYLALFVPFGLLSLAAEVVEGPSWMLLLQLFTVGMFLVLVATQLRAQRRRREMAQTADELLGVVRREVAFRRLMSLSGGLLALLLAVLAAALAAGLVADWSARVGPGARLVLGAAGAALLAAAVYLLTVVRPRQRRELEAHR